MPPNKDGDTVKDDNKKARKRNKPRKNRDDVPSRIRKTDRVVLFKQARDIIARVYDFMKKEALAGYPEKFTNARWRTATAAGISEKTVSRILKNRNKKLSEGAAVAGTGAVAHGKLEAAKNAEQALGNVLTGNFSGAAHNIGNAVGDVVAGDLAGASIMGSGIAHAGGQVLGSKLQAASSILATGAKAAGQVAAGKLGAVAEISAGLNSLAASNLTAATSHFSDAVGSVAAGDAAGLSTMFGL
ncbi:hypothetical protein NE865_14034 [Phthorimaea operculella]|nr:hypothetical protein NE865_14034 [Phthorimaea operculella]